MLSTLVLAGKMPVGRALIGALGMPGAALCFADGAITPAISVLSAVEGLTVSWPELESLVVPATVVILVVLFRVQSSSTARIGSLFGPVMLAWFSVLAVLWLVAIARNPVVLKAIDPSHVVWFFGHHELAVPGRRSGSFRPVRKPAETLPQRQTKH